MQTECHTQTRTGTLCCNHWPRSHLPLTWLSWSPSKDWHGWLTSDTNDHCNNLTFSTKKKMMGYKNSTSGPARLFSLLRPNTLTLFQNLLSCHTVSILRRHKSPKTFPNVPNFSQKQNSMYPLWGRQCQDALQLYYIAIQCWIVLKK